MARTTQQLAEAVLRRLAVIGSGNVPNADDATLVKDMYADLYQELEVEDVAFWPETSIPEHVFRALVDYIAGNAAPDFGQLDMVGLARDGRARLDVIAAESLNGEPVQATYY